MRIRHLLMPCLLLLLLVLSGCKMIAPQPMAVACPKPQPVPAQLTQPPPKPLQTASKLQSLLFVPATKPTPASASSAPR